MSDVSDSERKYIELNKNNPAEARGLKLGFTHKYKGYIYVIMYQGRAIFQSTIDDNSDIYFHPFTKCVSCYHAVTRDPSTLYVHETLLGFPSCKAHASKKH